MESARDTFLPGPDVSRGRLFLGRFPAAPDRLPYWRSPDAALGVSPLFFGATTRTR